MSRSDWPEEYPGFKFEFEPPDDATSVVIFYVMKKCPFSWLHPIRRWKWYYAANGWPMQPEYWDGEYDWWERPW